MRILLALCLCIFVDSVIFDNQHNRAALREAQRCGNEFNAMLNIWVSKTAPPSSS
jgi:hypothetical protein